MHEASSNNLDARQITQNEAAVTGGSFHPHGREWSPWNGLRIVKQTLTGPYLTFSWLFLAGPDKTSSSLRGLQGSPTERRPPWKLLRALSPSTSHWPVLRLCSTESQLARHLVMAVTTLGAFTTLVMVYYLLWSSTMWHKIVRVYLHMHRTLSGRQCLFEPCCITTARRYLASRHSLHAA
jgi:hypothetical protein